MTTRVKHRPRHYASQRTLRLGTPVLAYDVQREAYRLRLVGERFGPVFRPDRRYDAAGDARRGRRYTDVDARPRAASFLDGPSEMRQLGVIGAVMFLAVLIGFGVTLIPHAASPTRAGTPQPKVAVQAPHHRPAPSTVASGTATSAKAATTTPAHRSHPARAASHHGARHHRHAAARRHATTHHASAPASTPTTATTTPVTTSSTPVSTPTTPVQTTPPATHTTPPPTHITPTPTHTTPGSGSTGTSGGGTTGGGTSGGGKTSGAGTGSSGSSGGSGTVSGGG
jgi:hypothetical protein